MKSVISSTSAAGVSQTPSAPHSTVVMDSSSHSSAVVSPSPSAAIVAS